MSEATLDYIPIPAAASKHRLSTIEGMRFVCAFGVVWFHMQAPGWRFAYGALGLFVIFAVFFAVDSLARHGGEPYLRGRWQRVAMPWLGWSVFYLALNAVMLRDPLAALRLEDPLTLLVGPSTHLWFLPFLLLLSGVIALIEPATRSRAGLITLLVLSVPFSIGCFWAQTFILPPAPLAQWAYGLPCACYGLLTAQAKRSDAGPGAEIAPLIFLVLVVSGSCAIGATEDVGQTLLAAVVFELVWRIDLRGRWLLTAGALSYGIYLIHPVFMLVYHKFWWDSGHTAQAALFVFVTSFAGTAVLKRVPFARQFL